MNLEMMASMARKHLETYRPQETAQLKAEGRLMEHCHGMARQAQSIKEELMKQHYRVSEAEEVALKEAILLDPEPGADVEDWEREELDEKEREYQKMMAEPEELDAMERAYQEMME